MNRVTREIKLSSQINRMHRPTRRSCGGTLAIRFKTRRSLVALTILLEILVVRTCWSETPPHRGEQVIELTWPLGRSGAELLLLRLPKGYGQLNAAAEAMNDSIYSNRHRDTNKQANKDLLLTALWPGLVPDTGGNHAEFNQPGGGRLMMALLHSGAIENFGHTRFNALQSEFEIAVKFSTEDVCITPMDLHNGKGVQKAKCYDRNAPDIKSAKYGLDRLGVNFSRYPDFPEIDRSGLYESDIYYSRDPSGELRTVILCTAEEAKTVDDGPQYRIVPQCQHKFVSDQLNALVSINYRRVYLQDWRAIQTAWSRLLQSFVVEHKTISQQVQEQ
jgi:hypothetical protein